MNPRIVIDPNVQGGRPVIKGTRVPVSVVLAHLAGGDSRELIMREYRVSEEDIASALEYAVELVDAQRAQPARAS